jgi:hypothetical protein
MKGTLFCKKVAVLLTGLGFLAVTAIAIAQSESEWDKDHPRRNEVNERLHHQHERINQELREGKITQSQADQLLQEDRNIRQEERNMAAQNGGYITKQQQAILNQQENQVSQQIGK